MTLGSTGNFLNQYGIKGHFNRFRVTPPEYEATVPGYEATMPEYEAAAPEYEETIPDDYIYELEEFLEEGNDQRYRCFDLLVNKLEPTEVKNINQDLEEVVQRLRRSPETIHTLPSTSHAVLRLLLDSRRTKLMLKLLSNPLEFGIFPDHFMSNLLMDTFIEEKNYTAAARVASVLMLQEDFGPPLTQALAMASCYLYATSTENLPWEDYTVKIAEPEEELKIRIPYLRNPYFDDHFDLKEPNHIVGKTLAWGAPLIGGVIGTNCEILGWALYNKWSDLEVTLQRCAANSTPVAESVVGILCNFSITC
ncbi:small ribosomal subunit protein mS27-like [Macrobrachium nipponense]|uniref:small ribosomal subunit protein mS27-like n=1 Tax=Macrobrachium nipponense TaxID=159736 RepID=UPI0030C822DB